MEFLETLKKNLSSAANYTVKKANEITDISKLQIEINSVNGKLNTVMAELGRTAYEDAKAGTHSAEKIAAAVAKADALKEKIVDLKKQLAKVHGHVLCPACSKEISDTSVFCPACGVKLPKDEPAPQPSEDIPTEEE